MADNSEATQISPEIEQEAAGRAKDRANAARWDLNVAVFMFGVLIIIIILLFQGVGLAIVAPVALFGLVMVWLVGWRQGRQLYPRYYEEELIRLQRESKAKGAAEETVEEKIQKALRERWR